MLLIWFPENLYEGNQLGDDVSRNTRPGDFYQAPWLGFLCSCLDRNETLTKPKTKAASGFIPPQKRGAKFRSYSCELAMPWCRSPQRLFQGILLKVFICCPNNSQLHYVMIVIIYFVPIENIFMVIYATRESRRYCNTWSVLLAGPCAWVLVRIYMTLLSTGIHVIRNIHVMRER